MKDVFKIRESEKLPKNFFFPVFLTLGNETSIEEEREEVLLKIS